MNKLNFYRNIPAHKIGEFGQWPVGDYTTYPYSLFDKKTALQGIAHSKTFLNEEEAPIELFNALADGAPQGILPYIKGVRNGQVVYGDATRWNELACGNTQTGKTNYTKGGIISMMHFAHPEYLKIVIFDPKTAAFKALKNVCTVINNYDDIVIALQKLVDILRKRIELTGQEGYPSDGRGFNEYAYKYRKKNMLMPYIYIIFDEFADFMQRAKKENKNALDNIQTLASMGAGLNILEKYLTQAPYAEFIKGVVKNNFEGRIAFNLGDYTQEQLVLGHRKNNMESATRLPRGWFLAREQGTRVLYRALYCSSEAMEAAAINLRAKGFNYQLTDLA